ncbi:unnamed protein product, partial [Scytosiphon promiscuus]
ASAYAGLHTSSVATQRKQREANGGRRQETNKRRTHNTGPAFSNRASRINTIGTRERLLQFGTTRGAMEDGRDNYADILEELDPLPELPETADDRFFSKEELDFQYTTTPAENPLFPTWGSTGAEMAAIGAAAAANAASASASAPRTMTPPPPAAAKSTSRAARGGGGKKRALPPDVSQDRPFSAGGAAGAAVPSVSSSSTATAGDRTVFLRQRLGGESVSSGNSSTSAGSGSGSGSGSDNGSASDDVVGAEWEACAGGHGGGGNRHRRRGARRTKKPFVQSGGASSS